MSERRSQSETVTGIGTTPEGEVVAKRAGDQAWDCLLHEAKASREGESEVHVPGQVTVEASRQRSSERDRCQYFRMDVGDSRSPSPRADGGEPEEIGRIGQAAEDAFDLTDQSQDSAYRPSAAASAAARMATTGQAATCRAAKATTCCATKATTGCAAKEPPVQPPAPPATAEPEEIPEPKTPSVPGPKTPPTKPKAKSRPLTEEQKAVAEEMLAQKAQDLLRKAERGTATLKREKESSASGSGAKKVPKYLEHLTDDQRAHLFRTELSSEREAGSDRMGEGTCPPREGRGRTPKGARRCIDQREWPRPWNTERRSSVGRKSSRRENKIPEWRAEEEDRENLRRRGESLSSSPLCHQQREE